MTLKHARFIARTVIVKDGKVDEAFKILNRIMAVEGIFEYHRRTRYCEKPFQQRKRMNFETCKAIYNEDMARKIEFTLRTNRQEPWIGR